jgi:hypothetical protein
MMVRLTLPWKQFPAGHVIPEMQANVARLLISRHIAEEVKMASPLNRMMTSINASKRKISLR